MKQRKSPVILIVGVGCAITLLVLVNVLMSGQINLAELFKKDAPEAPEVSKEQAEQQNRASLAASVPSQKTVGDLKTEGLPGEMPSVSSALPTEPAIFLPTQQKYKPTLNESATSGMWYKDESTVKKKGDEVAKDRRVTGETNPE